jgi:putative PIN family toxin of toxin-antitoxin system
MRVRERVVVDTNVLVSALLRFPSIPGQAVSKVVDSGVLLVSEATIEELAEVLARPRLDRYVSREDRKQFLRQVARTAEFVPIIAVVRECRDPCDDKFLEVALNGKADVILIGDADLLAVGPWRGIAILSPAEYLKR